MTRGKNVKALFPDVIKNVASPSFTLRKWVYLVLLRYSDQEADLALMTINSLQKGLLSFYCILEMLLGSKYSIFLVETELNDQNALVRVLTLRTLSSIQVPAIAPLGIFFYTF
jgi:AP-3 complex subunit beta